MALGGGTFITQNKTLPGTYVNFVSAASASPNLSDRGIATIALDMNWGMENKIFTVTQEDFTSNCQKVLGYAPDEPEMKPIREIFKHARMVHFFRLNNTGVKASNTYATAKFPGTRGNDLRIIIEANENSTEDQKLYDVSTYLGGNKVDCQMGVSSAAELVPNDFVDWKAESVLSLSASTPLSGGTNGTVAQASYQTYLDQAEAFDFNAMGCVSTDETIKSLFVAFCKRMRDEMGKKFQCVVFRKLADYEGVVSVKNSVAASTNELATVGKAQINYAQLREAAVDPALIPWVTGVVAGTAVNKSATNMTYDGEYAVDVQYTQTELEQGIKEGSFMFHSVNGATAVLEDLNTFVSITAEKSGDFSSNQTIRVLDQIANDIAVLFARKYLGKIPNDHSGRISLWNDIVKHHLELQNIRAIEDFKSENVTVRSGDTKKAVVIADHVTPVNAMEQLYMTVYVS